MTVWIVLLSMLLPTTSGPERPGASPDDEPLRYRGIERLLAKFEAEER